MTGGGVTVFSGGLDDTRLREGERLPEETDSSVSESLGIEELINGRGIDEAPTPCRVGDLFFR